MITLASAIEWNQVAAFIAPLVGVIGLVGAFVGWVMNRISKRMREQVNHLAELNGVRQDNTNAQLTAQAKLMETLTTQVQNTALAVARIEGRQGKAGNDNAL